MIAAIALSLGAWLVGWIVLELTGNVVLGAVAVIATTALELAAGVYLTRQR